MKTISRFVMLMVVAVFSVNVYAEGAGYEDAAELEMAMVGGAMHMQEEADGEKALDEKVDGLLNGSIFGEPGTWDLNVYAGAYFDIGHVSNEKIAFVAVAPEYRYDENWALVGEFTGYYIDQLEDNAGAYSFNLVGRYHYFENHNSTHFFDVGGGLFHSPVERVPNPNGTHFNFTFMLGWGFKHTLGEHGRLIASLRYFHLSNANRRGVSRNPSFDGIGFFTGLTFDF